MLSYGDHSEHERTTWPNKLEYQLSLFSYILSLCTFWRFPYLAYENGGAPFIYVFMLLYIIVGISMVFLEMAWGQYGNLAPLQAFKIIPAMQGVGVCMLILSCALILYFGVASYYFLLYLGFSFSDPVPWSVCGNWWNSATCQVNQDPLCTSSYSPDLITRDGVKGVLKNGEFTEVNCNNTLNGTQISPSIEFWTQNLVNNDGICRNFRNISDTFFTTGVSNILVYPPIILGCFVGGRFLLGVLALAKHVRFTGKVAYMLSTIPFVVFIVMLVRSVTLSGAPGGLLYLFVPSDMQGFFQPKVWKDAIGQVFLTTLLSWGGLVTWSSYNRFYNKYHVDAAILILIIPIVSLLSAVTMFGIVGYLATAAGVSPADALHGAAGPIAPIIAYSEALSHMWGSTHIWSIVVFVTLFLGSTSSVLPALECIVSCLSDSLTSFRGLLLRNVAVIFLFLTSMAAYYGLPCFIEGCSGLQIIEFFDSFALPFCCIIVALAELLMLSYCFGFFLLGTNTKAMTGNSCLKSHFWSVMWGCLAPVMLLAVLIYSIVGLVRDGPESMAPTLPGLAQNQWTTVGGASLVGLVSLVLVLVAAIKVCQASGSCLEKIRNAFTPHMSRLSGNGGGDVSHNNGEIFMSDYTSHHERGIEVLIEDDIVTSV